MNKALVLSLPLLCLGLPHDDIILAGGGFPFGFEGIPGGFE